MVPTNGNYNNSHCFPVEIEYHCHIEEMMDISIVTGTGLQLMSRTVSTMNRRIVILKINDIGIVLVLVLSNLQLKSKRLNFNFRNL